MIIQSVHIALIVRIPYLIAFIKHIATFFATMTLNTRNFTVHIFGSEQNDALTL